MPKKKMAWDEKKIKSASKAFAKALKGLNAFEQEVVLHHLKINLGLEKAPRYIPVSETLTKKSKPKK